MHKVKIIAPGGFQNTTLIGMDAVPRVGDTISLGGWEGEVVKVIHTPVTNESGSQQYREEDEPGTQVVLGPSHQAR
jgi:hypothetical protein